MEHLQRFTENFILEGMSIVLKYYFYINGNLIHRIKGTVTGTHAEVVYTNFTFGYVEVKLFNKLPEIFYDIAGFFLKNYFRFLDDVNTVGKEKLHH